MMGGVDVSLPAGTAVLSENLAAAALALARRFGAGATMWCVSEWGSHGRHVAVEFVHPVIVGKRALPSVHIDGPDPARALRLLGRPGDLLLAMSAADDRPTLDVLRRAEAWGLTRVWLGAGPRPPAGYADHVIWLEGDQPGEAAHSGDLVLLYHLLWELTHVVFEHPGLVTTGEPVDPACPAEECITCSDHGDVAEVRALRPGGRAEVVVRGLVQEVDISLVDQVAPGDLIMIHAGVAICATGADAR